MANIRGDAVDGHVVAALRDAHGDPLIAAFWATDADEDQDDSIALSLGVSELGQLGANRIGSARSASAASALTRVARGFWGSRR